MPRKPPVDVECRRCGEIGHISDNCTSVQCRKCGRHGHRYEDCPQMKSAKRIRVWFMSNAELMASFSRQRSETDYDRIEAFVPLHQIPDDIGPDHYYHFGHAIASFKGSGMRRIQVRLSERATMDETLVSIDSKRINVGQRYVIEGESLNASVTRSSVGERGRAIPIGEGMCFLTIVGVDLFHQMVCIEVDEQRYILSWEGTAAGRRMRANVMPLQEFEAIVNLRNPQNRLSLQRYFAPAVEVVAVGVEPPADRPNANVLAIVEDPPNIIIDEPIVALPPIDVNAVVLVPEEDMEQLRDDEMAEVNAGEPIQVNENDDDIVIEHEELVLESTLTNDENEKRDVEAVESVDEEKVVDGIELNESNDDDEWHEPLEDEEMEGAVGGVVTEGVNAPPEKVVDPVESDRVIRLINEMTARRIAYLDDNAARIFAERIVRMAMPLSDDAPEDVLGELELLERAARRNQ